MYIYGGKNYGLIGYAVVMDKRDKMDGEKRVKLKFDFEVSQNIIETKIHREFFKNDLIKPPARWASVIQIDEILKDKLNKRITGQILPEISHVDPELSEENLLKSTNKAHSDKGSKMIKRYVRSSKLIGDRAELIVKKFLEETLSLEEKKTLKWLANEGETPGYDFSYVDLQNNEICIEVKGTVAKKFDNFNITINEWAAAEKKLENYYVYLVTECLGRQPKIDRLRNIFRMKQNQKVCLEPIVFRVSVAGE